MEDWDLPIYMIAPGKVYRRDVADPSHLPQFHQIEGLVVDRGITFGDLKGTLDYVCKQIFGPERKTRFRAHYFPFTEPLGRGGRELRHLPRRGLPHVQGHRLDRDLGLRHGGPERAFHERHRPEEYFKLSAWERIARLKYDVPDLRMLLEGDMRFLRQF